MVVVVLVHDTPYLFNDIRSLSSSCPYIAHNVYEKNRWMHLVLNTVFLTFLRLQELYGMKLYTEQVGSVVYRL